MAPTDQETEVVPPAEEPEEMPLPSDPKVIFLGGLWQHDLARDIGRRQLTRARISNSTRLGPLEDKDNHHRPDQIRHLSIDAAWRQSAAALRPGPRRRRGYRLIHPPRSSSLSRHHSGAYDIIVKYQIAFLVIRQRREWSSRSRAGHSKASTDASANIKFNSPGPFGR
jgi:hypothetical protein